MTGQPDPDDERLGEIVEDCIERARAGESIDVDALAALHPDLAPRILAILPAVLAVERCKGAILTRAGRLPGLVGPGSRLGEFEIEREIGRGGMGIVYAARQESLQRRVAIKVRTPTGPSDLHAERFRREAQTASRLRHPDIIPTHSLGMHGEIQYFVMPLIEGVGLDRALDYLIETRVTTCPRPQDERLAAVLDDLDAPHGPDDDCASFWRHVAITGARFADALHYAHQQGVWHRDIKPSNLMLEPGGKAWIADFGVAKATPTGDECQTADFVGTLHYAAPEQIDGVADPRSDVHGLGLTLLELAARERTAVTGSRRDLAARLDNGTTRRLRQCDRRAPRDLETILVKATAFEPSHRYPTAARFAADLRRFVAHEPIEARTVRAPERVWRWARRNTVAAALAATAAISMAAAAGVGWTAYWSTRNALAGERAAVEAAEANLELSLASLETVFSSLVGDERLGEVDFGDTPQVPALPEDDVRLIEQMLEFYERFASQNHANARLGLETARAFRRAGDIHRWMGALDSARRAYERSLYHYDLLPVPTRDAQVVERATIHKNLGLVMTEAEGPPTGHLEFQRARDLLRARLATSDDLAVRFELARLAASVGALLARYSPSPATGFPPRFGPFAARQQLELAVELAQKLVADDPRDQRFRLLLGRSLRLLAQVSGSESAESLAAVGDSLAQLALLAAESGGDPTLRSEVAEANSLLASMQIPRVEALARARAAVDQARGLVRDYAGIPDYEELLARVLRREAEVHARCDEPDAARERLAESATLLDDLRERHPWATALVLEAVSVARAHARLDHGAGLVEAARQHLDDALTDLADHAADWPVGRRALRAAGQALRVDLVEMCGESAVAPLAHPTFTPGPPWRRGRVEGR